MFEVKEKPRLVERAFLVGIRRRGESVEHADALLDELAALVETLGIAVVDREVVSLREALPRFLIGPGQAEAILGAVAAAGADVLIFDEPLSPAQQRNWEAAGKQLLVIDRQEVILDIFAERATTREARLQVELARLEYSMPRLRRAWTHLSRQRGGGSTQRGEGETQLQLDQRMIRDRIARLKGELEQVQQRRGVQRGRRESIPVPSGAIVGYTNAGKSSLLNCLTASSVLAEDKVFATLDPTSRRMELPNGQNLVLTDTVGFVRKLPHRLIDAFKATLEEAVVSDFLIHVVDASNPDLDDHLETTEEVLGELGALAKETILVLNKIDRVEGTEERLMLRLRFPDAWMVSVNTGEGIEALVGKLVEVVSREARRMDLLIPHNRHDLVHELHRLGAVKETEYLENGVYIQGYLPEAQAGRFLDFRMPEGSHLSTK
ncbi:MAG: GTPase HflX [Puniceicoccaceae bacterium]